MPEAPNTPGPYDLDAVRPVLAPDGHVTPLPVTPDFYPALDRAFPSFAGHVLIQTFAFDAPWGVWEVHPKGDEFVYLLEGDVDFLLKPAGEAIRRVRISRPGEYVVVPKGAWHTAEPHAPTKMLFVTPGEGTLNEAEPPD